MQGDKKIKEQAFTAAKVMIKKHVLKKSRESIPAICTKNWRRGGGGLFMKNVICGAGVENLVNVIAAYLWV